MGGAVREVGGWGTGRSSCFGIMRELRRVGGVWGQRCGRVRGEVDARLLVKTII